MSRLVAAAALAGVLACACAAPEASSAGSASAAPGLAVVAERLPVRVEFEPPLRAPGEVRYACESGFGGVVAAPPSGVDLRLPSGPATLTLVADGATRELALAVAPGMAPVRWLLTPARRIRAGDGIVDAGVAARTTRR